MNFLSILKKVGTAVLTAEDIIDNYKPLLPQGVQNQVGRVEDRMNQAVGIVTDAEVMGQALSLPGTDKSRMAAGPMFQLMMDLPVLQGKKPKDPAKAKAAAETLGGALADFLNCFEG